MKTVKVDDNAHEILTAWKEHTDSEGIENPSFSDAIRWAHSIVESVEIVGDL